MLKRLWERVREFLEIIYDPADDMPKISQVHLYNLNAQADRNYWYDKKGNRWPLRDSL